MVLVAEDDAILRTVLMEMCQALGYRCIAATDGQDCLDKLTSHVSSVGVVLMDLHMPYVSGLDAVRAIRSNPLAECRAKPVIAITADISWHDRRAILEQGFNDLVEKPMSLDRLDEALSRYHTRD